MKIYYAHPISTYDKPTEKRDIELLTRLFPGATIVNPNNTVHDAYYQLRGMQYFKDLVLTCTTLAFRAFPDGSIPAGVSGEIDIANEHDIYVIELPTAITRRSLTVDETREYLRDVGAR